MKKPSTPEYRDEQHIHDVIENNRSLKELRSSFHSWEEALTFFGNHMSEKYRVKGDSKTCSLCGTDNPEIQMFVWNAIVHKTGWIIYSFILSTLSFLLGFTVQKAMNITFGTSHLICRKCIKKQKLRDFAFQLLKSMLFAVFILSLIGSVPLLILFPVLISSGDEVPLVAVLILIAILSLVVISVYGFIFLEKWLIPPPFRKIGRWPFRLHSIEILAIKRVEPAVKTPVD